MNLDIKLHKEDLPDELILSDNIAIDCEFMGLNVEREQSLSCPNFYWES